MSIPARYIGLGLLLAGGVSPALADLAPLEAASLLAEARGADEKCAFLEPQESERLGYLAAKAEVAAVSAAGVEKAGSALQRARLKGETGTCEAETRTQVLEVYSAANLALKEATGEVKPGAGPMNITPPPTRPATRPVAPPPAQQVPRQPVSQHLPLHQPQHVPQPMPQPMPQHVPQPVLVEAPPAPVPLILPPAEPVKPRYLAHFFVTVDGPETTTAVSTPVPLPAPVPVSMPAGIPAEGLAGYHRRAVAYYLDMRCKHLSLQHSQLFWQAITAEHVHHLETAAPGLVGETLQEAQALASTMACDQSSAQVVQQAFESRLK